ncbi:MAG: GxxExxY protein [Paludibacter sp.]|jgi:GxxExxY protein|nr:GxxExxY protein [Paludibacter sp.]
MLTKDEYERIGKIILDCAFEVHKELGPGLLESIYEECLCEEIKNKGLKVENQVYLPLLYKGKKLNKNFRIDVLVEDAVILEIKSAIDLYSVDEAQLVSYMKLADKHLGYLLNFNVALLKDGIRRKVNKYFI